jgi:Ras-related protein Rab-6A
MMNNVLTGELCASSSINNYKIVVIGDINVGKTSILSRFRYGSFEQSYMPTLGIDFFTKNLFYEDKTIRLILWDTAGQERFRSLIPSYLKNADCIIIVYDITNKDSFNSLTNWLSDAKNNTIEGTIFVICGNKIDLKEKRVVTNEEIDEYIKKENLLYVECSAQNGEGIKELFNLIAKNLGESNFAKSEYINLDFNKNDNKIKDDIQSNYIIKNNNENNLTEEFKNSTQLTTSSFTEKKKKVTKKKKKRFWC